MRGAGSESGFVEIDGKLVGLRLTSNFCSEHEWGIKPLQNQFSIPIEDEQKFGIDRRRAHSCPPHVLHLKSRKESNPDYLVCHKFYREEDVPKNAKDAAKKLWEGRHPEPWDREKTPIPFHGAWDDRSFCVSVTGTENKRKLAEVVEAIQRVDVALFVGGGNPFGGGGLTLVIVSAAPEDGLKKMEDADRDALALKTASSEIGLEAELKASGLHWFALSPRWSTGFRDVKTSYPVVYWLNPYDQKNNNSGWYTVEDLRAWARNEGPVPKRPGNRK